MGFTKILNNLLNKLGSLRGFQIKYSYLLVFKTFQEKQSEKTFGWESTLSLLLLAGTNLATGLQVLNLAFI